MRLMLNHALQRLRGLSRGSWIFREVFFSEVSPRGAQRSGAESRAEREDQRTSGAASARTGVAAHFFILKAFPFSSWRRRCAQSLSREVGRPVSPRL